jgi:hypothetical protein
MRSLFVVAVLLALVALPLQARQELVTLPKRDSVQLTIYNSVDLTLVRETRVLTFREGNNRLQFSWANTLIDPTSVDFKALTHGDKIEILDTSYPPQSREMLIWTVHCEEALSAKVEISYFTSGISWSAEYHGILTEDESAMTLSAYVTVSNQSGEEYENATVRLVVGTIHLVEEIAALAGQQRRERMPQAHRSMRRAAEDQTDKRDITKEGLSEYYIYTVEGEETIPNRWAKRLESFVQKGVPLTTTYTLRPTEYGPNLVRILSFKNDEDHNLGKEPLPAGSVRLYRSVGDNRLAYIGAVTTDYIPRRDEVKVNVGRDAEVQLKHKRTEHKRENLVFQDVGRTPRLTGYDTVDTFTVTLKNFHDRDAIFELDYSFNGDFDFNSDTETEQVDFRTHRFKVTVTSGGELEITYTVRTRHGANSRNR